MKCDGTGFLTDLDLAISLQQKALLEASGRHHRTVRLSLLLSEYNRTHLLSGNTNFHGRGAS